MADKNRTTLSGITPAQLLHLKQLAYQMTGELSVSALIRHIADFGYVIDGRRLIVPGPKEGGKTDGD
jgi:hypothetical protein